MRRVTIEKHSHKTRHVFDSPLGLIDVEIETSTTIVTTMDGDDDEALFGCCTFEEEPLVPSPRRIPRRPR